MEEIIRLGFLQRKVQLETNFFVTMQRHIQLVSEVGLDKDILNESISELCLLSTELEELNRLETEFKNK